MNSHPPYGFVISTYRIPLPELPVIGHNHCPSLLVTVVDTLLISTDIKLKEHYPHGLSFWLPYFQTTKQM